MAKQRIVNTHFWNDPYILSLTCDQRLLFLWAITNPQTDLCGAYEAALSIIELQTGLSKKKIMDGFEKFAEDGKIFYRDGWVIVRNFTKHQNGTSTNVKKGAERSLNACPDWVKDTLSKDIHSRPVDTLPRPEPRPEPELKPYGEEVAPPKADANTKPKAERGTRIPDPFLLTAEMQKYAADKRPGVNVAEETEKFCNYYRSKTGKGSTQLDWVATWRNWILNARTVEHRSNGSKPADIGKYDPESEPIKPELKYCEICKTDTCLKDHRFDLVAA